MIKALRMRKYKQTSQANVQLWAVCITEHRETKMQAAQSSNHAASDGPLRSGQRSERTSRSEHAAMGGVPELRTGSRKVQAAKPSDRAAWGGAHDQSTEKAKVQAVKPSEGAARGGVHELSTGVKQYKRPSQEPCSCGRRP